MYAAGQYISSISFFGDPHMLQCYRCRCDLTDQVVQHRVVNTHSSVGGKGFANYYRKMPLCPKCASAHDFWQKMRSWTWYVVAAVVAGLAGLYMWKQYAH
jgi:hypothetical protein